jgi:hypothetical protein
VIVGLPVFVCVQLWLTSWRTEYVLFFCACSSGNLGSCSVSRLVLGWFVRLVCGCVIRFVCLVSLVSLLWTWLVFVFVALHVVCVAVAAVVLFMLRPM